MAEITAALAGLFLLASPAPISRIATAAAGSGRKNAVTSWIFPSARTSADALRQDQGLALLHAVRRRSEDRISALRAIEPAAKAAEERGYLHPLLTLELGIAFHQAMIDVCADFERRSPTRS